MSKKDYEKAARIAQTIANHALDGYGSEAARAVRAAFVELFRNDNPRFNTERFLAACVPGANVKARTRYTVPTDGLSKVA